MRRTAIKAAAAGGALAILLVFAQRVGNIIFPVEEGIAVKIMEGEIPGGGSLYNELVREFSVQETLQVSQALARVYNTRRIKPGDSYKIYCTTSGAVLKFIFDPDPLADYVVERTTAGFHAYETTPEIDERIVAVRGEIQSSLYAGLAGSGITDPVTIMNFAEIFQWQMDFLTEVRKGDSFMLVFSQSFVGGRPVRYGPILAAEYIGQRGRHTAVRFHDGNRASYFAPDGSSMQKQFLRAPLNYRRISSHFSRARMHPIHRVVRPHLGVDYAAPTGTPVSSIGSGRVTFIGWRGGYGNTVRVRHNATYTSQYAHLSRYARGLRVGQNVSQGEVIGFVGMTGTATGPHLDFRFEVNGNPVNFLTQNLPSAESVSRQNMPRFNEELEKIGTYLEYASSEFFFRNPAAIEDFVKSGKHLALSEAELQE